MERGTILETARKDASGALSGGLILLALCSAVLAFNWKYVYNFVAGPVPFTAALSASPGAREFVTASGTLIPTGVTEQFTVGLLRGAVRTTSTTARFLAMPVEGRLLIVKVDKDFSGNDVAGRLVALPAGLIEGASSDKVYPWYIDAYVGYRWDFNLFVLVAGLAFPLVLVGTLTVAWSRTSATRYAPIARLKRYGDPLQVVQAIELELSSSAAARVGPLWISATWMVSLDSGVRIYKLSEIVAAGYVTKADTSKPATHGVRLWTAGEDLSDTLWMSEKETRAVLTELDSKRPGIVTDDAQVFDKRWIRDREGCEREASARPSVKRTA